MVKNNVTRMLEARQVPYKAFNLPAEKLGAVRTADLLGVDLNLVYKTIVVKCSGRGKPILAVIPGSEEVDLKSLAKAVGEKKLILPTEKEAEKLTGLQAGGISPLALIGRRFQIVLDASANSHTEIHVSGGQRGLNIRLTVADFVHLTGAASARIGRPAAN